MLDFVLSWLVVILPTILALGIEVMNERVRKHPSWRWMVIVFGVVLSSLTAWQQHRSVAQAQNDREAAITETADKVSKQTTENVTNALAKQYGSTIKEMASQLAEQGKRVTAIGDSPIVTGKRPVAVVVTNPSPTGTPKPEIHVTRLSADPKPELGKNAVRFILTTTMLMNGGRVRVSCSKGKINQGSASIPGANILLAGGGGIEDEHTYVSGISSPNWSPDFPLLITLYFDSEDLGTCNFRPLQ